MSGQEDHLETLHEIRNLMERSSRFISLSGLSGVFAGLYALLGAGVAYWRLQFSFSEVVHDRYLYRNGRLDNDTIIFLLTDALLVLLAALVTGIWLTTRKAQQQGLPVWNHSSKRLLVSLLIPLAAGGLFCLALLYHGIFGMIAPATLLFYGLALLNGSKYTLHDVHYLGISEISLGILSAFAVGYGLLFWAIGFGVLHILYGTLMYYKYER